MIRDHSVRSNIERGWSCLDGLARGDGGADELGRLHRHLPEDVGEGGGDQVAVQLQKENIKYELYQGHFVYISVIFIIC